MYNSSDETHRTRLKESLQKERGTRNNLESQYFFDIEPHAYQKEILESLLVEREVHSRNRNLIVAATGAGKTVISAFDFKHFYKVNPSAKLLFVAHREEILIQARSTFRAILREHSFGELWLGEYEPAHFNHLFMSIQTLNIQINTLMLSPVFFDFIIIDEVHHISADSYRPILHSYGVCKCWPC
ncbi:MAG: DEAD/DEAH box helicase family protein [Fibrobacterota bacterium]|nr:DEAD/DEAH box helicase family protein [Chitinispirillaceae bacterium]